MISPNQGKTDPGVLTGSARPECDLAMASLINRDHIVTNQQLSGGGGGD